MKPETVPGSPEAFNAGHFANGRLSWTARKTASASTDGMLRIGTIGHRRLNQPIYSRLVSSKANYRPLILSGMALSARSATLLTDNSITATLSDIGKP